MTAVAVPSTMTTSRVRPMPRRTDLVELRLRPVGLSAGGGDQQGGAVPDEGQRDETGRAAVLGRRCDPGVDVVLQAVQGVLLALLQGAGGR
ncbi:hypothetical protein GCM10020256_04350 [Streptomyces thermocoprophilus]